MRTFCCKQPWDEERVSEKIEKTNEELLRVTMRNQVMSQIGTNTDMRILKIGDFTKKQLIGSGISSKVHLFVRESDGRKFAGKIFKSEVVARDFLNEAKIMNMCSNSCASIVNMFGITTTPNCLLMDYHVNGSLDIALLEDEQNIKDGQKTEFPFLRRLGYILDMCKAVTELHLRNICHRDIAMRNLLLSDDKKRVLLTDFSLSEVVSSAIETQSTYATVMPKESAPESIGKHNSTTLGRNRYERQFSLKSDVWNVGITMYGIIEKRLSVGKRWVKPPCRFPTKSLPPKEVFNRKEDLWRAMLRCWHLKPELRPQSWELQQLIDNIVQNPLNHIDDNDGYILDLSHTGSTNTESTYDDRITVNSRSQYTTESDRNYVNTSERHSSTVSLTAQNALSSDSLEEESMYSLKKITESANTLQGRDIKMLVPNLENCSKSKMKEEDIWESTLSNLDIYKRVAPLRPRQGSMMKSSESVIREISSLKRLENSSYKKLLEIKKSYPVNLSSYLTVNWGVKFLKRLGSLSSVISTSLSSGFNTSVTSMGDAQLYDRVQYCSPLSGSFRSSVTDIRCCSDRRFFGSSRKLFASGKVDSSEYILSSKLLPVKENSSACQLVTDDTKKNLNISVK